MCNQCKDKHEVDLLKAEIRYERLRMYFLGVLEAMIVSCDPLLKDRFEDIKENITKDEI